MSHTPVTDEDQTRPGSNEFGVHAPSPSMSPTVRAFALACPSDHESDDEPSSLRYAHRHAATVQAVSHPLVPNVSHSEDRAALSGLPSFTGDGVDSVLSSKPLPSSGSDHESDDDSILLRIARRQAAAAALPLHEDIDAALSVLPPLFGEELALPSRPLSPIETLFAEPSLSVSPSFSLKDRLSQPMA